MEMLENTYHQACEVKHFVPMVLISHERAECEWNIIVMKTSINVVINLVKAVYKIIRP